MSIPDSLPTTPLERYLARSHHGAGMIFDIILILEGHLDMERLQQAWFETVEQHPCLFAHLVGSGRSKQWKLQASCDPSSFVRQRVPYNNESPIAHSVDPHRGVGIQCIVASDDQTHWSVRIVFHHACCDGVGAIRIFGQFAKRYACLLESPTSRGSHSAAVDPAVSGRAITPQGIRAGKPTRPPSATASADLPSSKSSFPAFGNIWTTIRGSNVRLSRHMANVKIQDRCGGDDDPGRAIPIDPFQGHHRILLPPKLTDQIRGRLKTCNIKLNDWAIAITMQVLSQMTHSHASDSRHLMVLNPVEMRTWSDRRDTRNHIGIALIRRRHQDLRPFSTALRSLSGQLTDVRDLGIAAELAYGIAIAERIPWALLLVESLGTFTPTVSLTCLTGLRLGKRYGVTQRDGDAWIGNAKIKDIFFDAPIQRGAELSVAVWDFEGSLAISCRPSTGLASQAVHADFLTRWSHAATHWAEQVDEGNQLATNDLSTSK